MLIDLHRSEIREEWRLSTSTDGNGMSMTKPEKQTPVGWKGLLNPFPTEEFQMMSTLRLGHRSHQRQVSIPLERLI
jgi:hypothetical protein